MIAKISQWCIAFLCLVLIILAASLSWLRVGVDQHPLYHQWVEHEVSKAIGQELKLTAFQVKLVGTSLQLNLNGIDTKNGLTLSRLDLGVDLKRSLQQNRFRLSHVQATGLDIHLGQQEDGTWGPQTANKSGSQTVPQLMLAIASRVPQFLLNDVTFTLMAFEGEPITTPQLNAQVHVAKDIGQELTRINVSVHGDTKAPGYNLETKVTLDLTPQETIQRAQVYLSANHLEVASWLPLFGPFKPTFYADRLRLDGKYWLDYQANKQVQLVTENAQILLVTPTNHVALIGDTRAVGQLGNLATSKWQLADWKISAQALSGKVNGVALPLTELKAQKTDQQLWLASPKLHLANTQKLLNTIKGLPSKVNLPIQSLAPKGWLNQAQLHLDSSQPKEFLVNGKLQQVSVGAWLGVPEIKQVDGHIWLNRYGGKVIIDDTDGVHLRLAKLTSAPWKFGDIQGEFNWHYGALANRFSSSNIVAKLNQGHINLSMAGSFPRKGSTSEPFIQLALGMQNIDLGQLPGMLPDIVLGKKLGAWITRASPVGTVTEAALIYNGRPGKLNGASGDRARTMPIAAQVEAPSFSYHAQWPQVTGLKATLTVNHKRVLVDAVAGSLDQGLMTQSLKGWQVEVPVYQATEIKNRYIRVNGQIAGEAEQMMTLAEELPLNVNLPPWLRALKPLGKVSLDGSFAIPFGHQSDPSYDLSLSSKNLSGYWAPLQADLRHVEVEVGLASADAGMGPIAGNGLIDGQLITFKRLSEIDLETPWLSKIPQPILHQANVNARVKQDHLTMEFEGRLPPHYLATKLNQPWVHEIPGALPFVARLSTCTQATTSCSLLSAELDLTKADLDLPEPLNQLQQLQLLGHWQDDYQNWYASIDQHQVAVKLGPNVNSNGLTLLGANVAFQNTVDWAQDGQWVVDGQLDDVDIDSWWAVYQTRIKPWWANPNNLSVASALPQINVDITRATGFGLEIDQATLSLLPLAEDDGLLPLQPWRAQLVSEQIAGKVDYMGAGLPLLVHIDYAYLNFPEPASETTDNVDLLENIDPNQLIDADVSIDKLVKNGDSFGQWQFKARRQGDQVNVHDLDADIRHSHLQGNLIWDKVDGVHRTQFTGRAESKDMRSLLTDWGYDPAVVAETSAIEVQLDWPRSPLAFALKEVSGDLGLRLKKGSFSSSPNAAKGLRVLALFDMSRLVKRVKLDFSDIIQPGFSFDSLAAHYRFDHGFAATVSPSTIKSATLNLSMDGWIDFNQRQVDNNLIVTLPVADKLPLAALIAGLPQLGSMIYVVNKLIGDELSTFTSARYRVAGSLDNPDVKLVKMFDKDYQKQSVQERIDNVISIE